MKKSKDVLTEKQKIILVSTAVQKYREKKGPLEKKKKNNWINAGRQELMEELPAVMRRGLLSEEFSAREIAGVFGLHERTLHRRLQSAGTSFRRELDSARMCVGEQLLGSPSLPVIDVASALGYADSSGFIRAFQRWSGCSPSAWRKLNSPLYRNRSIAGHQ